MKSVICPVCRRTKTVSPHHIVPIAEGGTKLPRNIVWLCEHCHNLVEEFAENGVYYSPSLAVKIRLEYIDG